MSIYWLNKTSRHLVIFQLEVYYKVDRLLTGLPTQQKWTTARWYSNKTSLRALHHTTIDALEAFWSIQLMNKPVFKVICLIFSFLRYLIQQLTGKLTGSIYDDGDLRVNGFPGESKANERVLVVKTHEWGQKVRSR